VSILTNEADNDKNILLFSSKNGTPLISAKGPSPVTPSADIPSLTPFVSGSLEAKGIRSFASKPPSLPK